MQAVVAITIKQEFDPADTEGAVAIIKHDQFVGSHDSCLEPLTLYFKPPSIKLDYPSNNQDKMMFRLAMERDIGTLAELWELQ